MIPARRSGGSDAPRRRPAGRLPIILTLAVVAGSAAPSPGFQAAGRPPSASQGPREADVGGPSAPRPPETAPAFAPPIGDPATPSVPESAPPYPIDLPTALRLADGHNPVIGVARVQILEALAQRSAARALLLPHLNAGLNYHDHNGPLQRASGTILNLKAEQSLYFGGGARTLAAESVAIPAVNIFSPLTEAIYEPLAAQQRLAGVRLNASATVNAILLDVAALYIDLIGAEATLEARRESLAEADRIVASVVAFAATGQGRKADAHRAEADRRLFQAEVQRAEEEVAVASARLAERLTLDPSSRLRPLAGPLEPIALVDPEVPTDELIRSAVARRPDLAARDALAMQAHYQVNKEKARPFLPTIWLGFSGGAFGGGSALVPPTLGHFNGRTDFDVRAYWTLLNFGAGNASLVKQRKAQFRQAMAERSRVLNQVRSEVATARAESLALRSRVVVARRGLQSAQEGYRDDQARLRETLGKPIEALDSLRLLAGARVNLIRAITQANRSQFALFVSLGAPPPLAPAPISPPPPG